MVLSDTSLAGMHEILSFKTVLSGNLCRESGHHGAHLPELLLERHVVRERGRLPGNALHKVFAGYTLYVGRRCQVERGFRSLFRADAEQENRLCQQAYDKRHTALRDVGCHKAWMQAIGCDAGSFEAARQFI